SKDFAVHRSNGGLVNVCVSCHLLFKSYQSKEVTISKLKFSNCTSSINLEFLVWSIGVATADKQLISQGLEKIEAGSLQMRRSWHCRRYDPKYDRNIRIC